MTSVYSVEQILSDSKRFAHRRARIVATVGPASREAPVIKRLIEAGVNVFRLNFSHGTHAEHMQVVEAIRAASKELDAYVAIMQDLCGPKIRISKIAAGSVSLKDGGTIKLLHSTGQQSNEGELYIEAINPSEFLKIGQQVLLADGALVLEVTSVSKESVSCKIIKGDALRSNAGVCFVGSRIGLSALTDKDRLDLAWGIKNEIDYVALSFVSSAQDIIAVRKIIDENNGHAKIVAKIERRAAVENLESILDVSDGIMVARGDLGLEVSLEKLPILQKLIVERANSKGIPAIVATEMLQSMITAVRPTRAEVADVSLAVLNGADAVMLSGETAIGKYPVEAVGYLDRIIREAEQRNYHVDFQSKLRGPESQSIPDAVVFAACGAAEKLDAAAIIACTETGTSARLTAKYRPIQPLYGASASEITLRRMCMYWGVIPLRCASTVTHQDELLTALQEVQRRENLPNGSAAVITGGLSVRTPGATSVLEVRQMNFKN